MKFSVRGRFLRLETVVALLRMLFTGQSRSAIDCYQQQVRHRIADQGAQIAVRIRPQPVIQIETNTQVLAVNLLCGSVSASTPIHYG